MANKKITIEVDVDTKKVDDAVAKTGKLKDLGKGLKIQYDIDGKPVDIVIDKTLNLQKQVKLLTAELRRTKEGTAEFTLLSNRLNDTKDDLGRVTAKSNELFGTLSLLPGPIGQFSAALQGGLDLLKTFSGFKLSDFKAQFKGLGADLGSIVSNLAGFDDKTVDLSKNVDKSSESISKLSENLTNATSNLSGAQLGAEKTVASVEKLAASFAGGINIESIKNNSKQLEQAFNNLVDAGFEPVLQGVEGMADKFELGLTKSIDLGDGTKDLTTNFRKLEASELQAALSTKNLTLSAEGLVVAEGAASAATLTLTTVLEGLAVALGIAGLIIIVVAAISKLLGALSDWASGTKEVEKAQKDFNRELEQTNELLELDTNDLKRRNQRRLADLKGTLNEEKGIREENVRSTKEQLKLVEDALDAARKREDNAYKRQTKRYGILGMGGVDEKAVEEYKTSQKKTTELDQKAKDLRTQLYVQDRENNAANNKYRLEINLKFLEEQKKLFTKELADIEAKIKLEIDKEKTGRDELEKLLKKKLELRKKLEGIIDNSAQEKVIIAEHKKLLNDSLIDDTQRTIQAEIDKNNRLAIESGIGTKELFEAKKKMAQEQFLFELKEAERDEKTKNNKIENARTKYWKTLIDIDKEALDARIKLSQEKFDAQYEGTEKFFELQRQLELDNYAKQQADARDNYDQLEAIKQGHQKKLIAIDIAELQYKAGLEGRKAETEQENYTKVEDRFMESFAVIKDLNTRKYDDLRKEEDFAYQAQIKAAGDNVKIREQIEREHAAKMRQIGADEVEAKKQTTLMIENVTQQFGQTIGQIGDLMMQESQGRDKKMFEAGKKAAIAGIAIEKIATIASIVTNTAIANAKAVAAFPLTLGMPWVAINTVSAGLSIAATIAAGISAISQINGTNFEAAGGGAGGATSPGNQLGRNYEKGGIINGKRHAEGGTMIEAEKGEAIMTRGAVTAFSPLLSMMNQMGGGTSFTQGAVGQAGFDNPKVATPSQEQTPMIVKTYVVSTDMTSEQNKQARLKNLSTL